MFPSLGAIVSGLALFSALVAGSPLPTESIPKYFQRQPLTRREVSPLKFQQELGAQLSLNATILGPEAPNFANLTHRWNLVAPPEIELVVQAGQEADVSKIVSLAQE